MKPAHVFVSAPCDSCPFRADVFPFITPNRVREIRDAAIMGTSFVCHKTVYDENHRKRAFRKRRTCAGFLHVCMKDDIAGGLQIVQVAERLTNIRLDHLRGAELTYASFDQMIEAHTTLRAPRK